MQGLHTSGWGTEISHVTKGVSPLSREERGGLIMQKGISDSEISGEKKESEVVRVHSAGWEDWEDPRIKLPFLKAVAVVSVMLTFY